MATAPCSTGPEGAAALLAQAKREGVGLSVDPSGGLRCVGRMSPNLRAGLLSSKEVVLGVLRQGVPRLTTSCDDDPIVRADHGPLIAQLDLEWGNALGRTRETLGSQASDHALRIEAQKDLQERGLFDNGLFLVGQPRAVWDAARERAQAGFREHNVEPSTDTLAAAVKVEALLSEGWPAHRGIPESDIREWMALVYSGEVSARIDTSGWPVIGGAEGSREPAGNPFD